MNVNGIEIHASLDESVISGTMRPQDLIPAFLNVIKETPEYVQIMFPVNTPWGLQVFTDPTPFNDDDERWESEEISYFLNETLFEVLNNYAPDGYYFGSHLGNGSDYGYWQQEEIEDEPFVVHGIYAWSNACGYEVQLSDSGDAARLRMPESGKVTEWLEIEWIEDKEWNEACDNGDELCAVIDPGHYNVPLDLTMRVTLDGDNSWTDPAGGVHYGDDDDPAAMYE